jgi:hypothetical protein
MYVLSAAGLGLTLIDYGHVTLMSYLGAPCDVDPDVSFQHRAVGKTDFRMAVVVSR